MNGNYLLNCPVVSRRWGWRLYIRKLILGILLSVPVFYTETDAEMAKMETEHFQMYEIIPNEKITIKCGNLVSSELDCVNLYQSRVQEINENEFFGFCRWAWNRI